MDKILYIDYIKFISIIMIIIYHCNYRDSLGFDAAFTLMGVCYFFAVNGYLILSKDRTIIYK